MDTVLNSKDDKKARVAAFIFAIVLLILILYPFWSYPFPPPEKEGILVSFGEIDLAGGDQVKEASPVVEEQQQNSEEQKKTSTPAVEEQKKVEKAESKPEVVTAKNVSDEKSPVVAKEKPTTKEDTVADAKKTAAAKKAAAQKAKEAAEAKKAADEAAKQAEFEKTKKQFGDLLGKGSGKGTEAGQAGDPTGEPSTSNLTGLIAGKGKIQGGLADRGLVYVPEISEKSQKAGKVVVRVCVDNQGIITEAKYTQKGSTTTDSGLVKAAEDGAKKYRFSKSLSTAKQCGTITIEFKLK